MGLTREWDLENHFKWMIGRQFDVSGLNGDLKRIVIGKNEFQLLGLTNLRADYGAGSTFY